jgi:hypothetical protein
MSLTKCEQLSQVARIIVVNSRDDPAMSEKVGNILGSFVSITDRYLDSVVTALAEPHTPNLIRRYYLK